MRAGRRQRVAGIIAAVNVLLLKAWLNNHAASLIGARLAAVEQLDERSFCLHLLHEEGVRYLLCSTLEEFPVVALLADPQAYRIEGTHEGNFAKALRFHLSGYQLMSVVQPGFERSVSFTFSQRDAYGRITAKVLTVELAGRASNAFLLTSQRMVVSIFKRVRHGQNRVRHVMTGKLFPDPPPLGKYIAAEGGVSGLAEEYARIATAAGAEGDALEELIARRCACGDLRIWPVLSRLVPVQYELQSLYDFILAFQRGEYTGELFELGPEHGPNEAGLEAWLEARGKRGMAPRPVSDAAAKLTARIDQLMAEREKALQGDELEQLGLAMLAQAEAYDQGGKAGEYLRMWAELHPVWGEQLAPERSVYDNAQELIHLAQRLKRGLARVDEAIEKAQEGLSRIELGPPEKAAAPLRADTADSSVARLKKWDLKYLRFVSSDGLAILCGVSDRSNDGLLRAFGSSRQLWLHARDYPGSHVILLTDGKDPPARSLEEAAIVAGYHSQGRGEMELEVSYVPMKQIRRPRDGKPGQVLKLSEKVLSIRPAEFNEIRERIYYKGDL